MFYSTTHQSPVGAIKLASSGGSLVGLWTEGQKYHGAGLHGTMVQKKEIPLFFTVKRWLERYFSGDRPDICELPLAPIGGEFPQKVWKILRGIPYGEVITYGDIAKQINCKSAQAVGGAVGHNPISIIIPCHRVVGSNGSLTGFSGGVQMKIKLLELEGVDMSKFYIPKKGTAL